MSDQTDNERTMPNEEWRPIAGYESTYSISSLGRVWSERSRMLLSLNSIAGYGYVKTFLHVNGRKDQRSVHRLVAEAFLEKPEGANEVNHLNGIKTDNRAVNLAWCTRSENVDHSYNTLGHRLHSVKAEPIAIDGEPLVFASIKKAVDQGFVSAHIHACLRGERAQHAGYRWMSLRNPSPLNKEISNEDR